MAIAVVTGSSTGIGLATAVTLARAGHTVYATMRNPKMGGRELREIAEREHLPVHIGALDVDSDESVRKAFAKILVEAGRIDVLVNNAGISVLSAVEETPIDASRAIMETNYSGALRCIQAVVPGMRERRSGCIVNVTSVTGRLSVAANAAYSSSKFALEAASEALAQEVKAFGVRVALVEPASSRHRSSVRCNRRRLTRSTRIAGASTDSSGLPLRIPFLPTSWGKRFARLSRVGAGN